VIRYALSCSNHHQFEAWFRSSEIYETQRAAAEIACPNCGSTDVDKALMSPAVSTAKKKDAVKLAANTTREADLREAVRKLRAHIVENSEYVGDRFAEEARKIHHEETEKRGIYGEATPDEARSLVEEGIEFAPLPILPEDRN
jgi:hypothetical protein